MNVLIAVNSPTVSEPHVGENAVVRQEWLVRNAPAKTDRREGSPLMAGSEVGRAVFSEGKARNVFVGEIEPCLPEERQQRVLSTSAEHVLGAWISQWVLDIAGGKLAVQQVGDVTRKEAVVASVRFLTEQQVETAPRDRLHEPGGVGPGPVQLL